MKIGYIRALGLMGHGMAKNMQAKDHALGITGHMQAMAKPLDRNLTGFKFELDNARKEPRYYPHMAEAMAIPTLMGEAAHQSLSLAGALGYGKKFVPSLVEAQERLTGAQPVPRT